MVGFEPATHYIVVMSPALYNWAIIVALKSSYPAKNYQRILMAHSKACAGRIF